ncbi:hypothetical protein EBT31_21170, partial [bacterium]|nr:hypothetical protein [bacterium]
MSEPKRYALMGNPWEMVEHKNGNLVFYEDYARLKAEVEQWKFTLEEERQIMREDWAGLRCEKD